MQKVADLDEFAEMVLIEGNCLFEALATKFLGKYDEQGKIRQCISNLIEINF